jgi:hypothetical protein
MSQSNGSFPQTTLTESGFCIPSFTYNRNQSHIPFRHPQPTPSPDPPPYELGETPIMQITDEGSPRWGATEAVHIPLDIAFSDARKRLTVNRGMKQDIMTSLKDVTDFKTFWDPNADIEISPARSATSHTDLRLMSSYTTFSDKLKADLLEDSRIAKTVKRADWAWELRCIIGLRAVEDLALTIIAQGIGKKDHRDFDGTYEELIQAYLSTPRPLLRLSKTDLAYLANSPVRQAARDYIHPKLEEAMKLKELFNHVTDYLEEKATEEGGDERLARYQKFILFVQEGH